MTDSRVLIVFPWLPYPPMGGADLRNLQTVYAVSHCSGQVAVAGVLSPDKDYARPKIDNLAYWHSTFGYKKDENMPSKETVVAATRNLATDYCYTQKSIDDFTRMLDDFRPAIALVSQLAPYPFFDMLKKHGCRMIFDCHNIEGLLVSDVAQSVLSDSTITGAEKMMYEMLIRKTRMIEARLCHHADRIWVCSERDRELVGKIYNPPHPVDVIPNAVDTSIYTSINTEMIDPSVKGSNTVIFPAYFAYTPNTNAARLLINDFFPGWKKHIPGLKLLLAGRDPSPDMCNAAQADPDIIVTGSVPDILPWLAASKVMIAPVFEGSGTRLKILQAFAARLPVVSTIKGAEGLACVNGNELLIAETGDEFCSCIKKLLFDSAERERITACAFDFVEKNYSWKSVFPVVAESIGKLSDDKNQQ